MGKRVNNLILTMLFLIASLSFISARDYYYSNDGAYHFNTVELDDDDYDKRAYYFDDNEDDYRRIVYYSDDDYDDRSAYYDSQREVYYSNYDGELYIPKYRTRTLYYRRPIVYSEPYVVDYGHGPQISRYRVNPYREDEDYIRKYYPAQRIYVQDRYYLEDYGYEKVVKDGKVYFFEKNSINLN